MVFLLLAFLASVSVSSATDGWASPLSEQEFQAAGELPIESVVSQDDTIPSCVKFSQSTQIFKDPNATAEETSASDRTYNAFIFEWDNGIIPYVISDVFNEDERLRIARGMSLITDKVPCVGFVPRTDEEDYVEITGEPTGCFVYTLGNSGGPQILNLARNGCVWADIVAHELLHKFGQEHEQNRPDRDRNIEVYWNRISSNFVSQYWKSQWEDEDPTLPSCIDQIFRGDGNGGLPWSMDGCTGGRYATRWRDIPYDVLSVMHYGPYAATLTGYPVMRNLNGPQWSRARDLSEWDVLKLKRLYGCEKRPQLKKVVCLEDFGQSFSLSCPEHETINVVDGYFGRTDSQTCSEGAHQDLLINTDCRGEAKQQFRASCQNRNSCSFLPDVRSLNYGKDPCKKTWKYLDLTYECVPEDREVRSVTGCDGKAVVDCEAEGEGKVIEVITANWGRTDENTCSNEPQTYIDCYSKKYPSRIEEGCNGLETCKVRIGKSGYRQCPGIPKYLEILYKCVEPVSEEEGEETSEE